MSFSPINTTAAKDETTSKVGGGNRRSPRGPPKDVAAEAVGGFINDVAAISPFGLLTAQSAGMKPLPGESLRPLDMIDFNLFSIYFQYIKSSFISSADVVF